MGSVPATTGSRQPFKSPEWQQAKNPCILTPINLYDSTEFSELLSQRLSCGWDNTAEVLESWRSLMDRKLKGLFWIVLRNEEQEAEKEKEKEKEKAGSIRTGHISLDSYTNPPDPELAREDKTILTVQTFYLHPAYRRLGLGRAAMDLIEAMATEPPYGSPACTTIALNTLLGRYYEDDSPEWGGMWTSGLIAPLPMPGGVSTSVSAASDSSSGPEKPYPRLKDRRANNQKWYERRGYVLFKEEPRYEQSTTDGGSVTLIAAFLRKPIQAADADAAVSEARQQQQQ